ncbi:MAG: class I SAM-dependent methyltransferase [Actinomycetota bacterium]|nr:class I SAM-dependent methyltransferase [Actinomycetota bacterium]
MRAFASALMTRDYSSLGGVTRPRELVPLLRGARDAARIVEVGTGTAWTAICLALANPRARVATYDIAPIPYREPYIRMLDSATRERIEFVTRDGNDPLERPGVDLVFIDASHERDDTIRTFHVWEPLVAGGGMIAFHDYLDPRWPGVTEAVSQLGLHGQTHGHLFVWIKPDEAQLDTVASTASRSRSATRSGE